MRGFLREAGRETARLVARRTLYLGLFTAACAPLWLGWVHPIGTLVTR